MPLPFRTHLTVLGRNLVQSNSRSIPTHAPVSPTLSHTTRVVPKHSLPIASVHSEPRQIAVDVTGTQRCNCDGYTVERLCDLELSDDLIGALSAICREIPQLASNVQRSVLNIISLALVDQPYRHPGAPARMVHFRLTSC
jgi:hypothetical protein